MAQDFCFFSGGSNPPLSKRVTAELGLEWPLCMQREVHPDGEINAIFTENVRRREVFLLQSTNVPHDNVVELLLMIDAAWNNHAERVVVVMPYFGYARADRKDRSRKPIGAKAIARTFDPNLVSEVAIMDPHFRQISGFFDVPVDLIYSAQLLIPVIIDQILMRLRPGEKMMFGATDVGGGKMPVAYLKSVLEMLQKTGQEDLIPLVATDLVLADKQRISSLETRVENVTGDPSGCYVVIVDDIASTLGSADKATNTFVEMGATRAAIVTPHLCLSGDARRRLAENDHITKLIGTDSIFHESYPDKVVVVSCAPLVAETIRRIHTGDSVSVLSGRM